MLNFTQEQLEVAKSAKSVGELLEIAKDAGIELTEELAERFLLPPVGELSDEDLESVSGGRSGGGKGTDAQSPPNVQDGLLVDVPTACHKCGNIGSLWSQSKVQVAEQFEFTIFKYDRVKCYDCGTKWTYAAFSPSKNIWTFA